MWTRASAATVPVADRFEWFNELVASALIPTAIKSEESADFRAEAAMLDLGVTQVSTFAHSPLSSRRTPALIRRGDPEQYQLALITGGRWWMSHSGGDEEFGVGDMILWDTSRPQETVAHPGDGPSRSVILHLPKDVLPLRSGRVDRLLGRRIASDSGMAAVLAGFIASLREHGSACEPQELRRLGSVAVDLAAACLAHRLDAYGELPAEARARALRERIDAFIEHNLGDPALTPGLIAAAHGISVRSLHMLFGEEGESVSAAVRRRRLERARADLARPELAGRPVHDIAARWCFTSAPAFSRAFRAAYGLSPTEFRSAAALKAGTPR
ncbi:MULTISPECIES: helix-turn-helix domain-containing protein [unclassified Streptomyces]|uniref:AraC-like ligand-binding domain-containing protein n=1 Tax=unclassified Streptomyces TaxID=2593676 RepID=UPI00225A1838|nr:helix-turn-helix domain-containing protein [Streptomyces sp. NBC_00047]MCX5606935.1 helix-turn-helix domain-containing protein [Streptomyces sp. NBC_00047]